jgi:manganese/iron transport system ATP-binding protein
MGSYAQLPPLRRVGRRERLVAAECLETVGLGGMGEERFASLSGGQRQRVLIARALAAKPSLLLLDEPTAGVDAEATAAIMSALSRLNRDQHLTILLVTHHVRMVRDLATAVFWVQDGRVLRGQVEEILTPGRLAGAFGIAGDGG